MQIAFEHHALKQQCEQPSVARRTFGTAGAKKLARRLNELLAAEQVSDLILGDFQIASYHLSLSFCPLFCVVETRT